MLPTTKRFTASRTMVAMVAISLAEPTNAQTTTCVTGSAAKLCVGWNRITPPIQNVHFRAELDGEFISEVSFLVGDPDWFVYAETLVTPPQPADFGSITIDPTVSTDDFVVTIVKPGAGAGASNVGSILLLDSGWSGYSSIAGGSSIAGDLTGDLVVLPDASGNGGELTLSIGNDLIGSITAERLVNLAIGGNVAETGTITATHFQELVVNENLAGSVFLENGIPEGGRFAVGLELSATGVVDLNHGEVAGELSFQEGGAGTVLHGGVISSNTVVLAGSATFSGSATFDGVAFERTLSLEGGLELPAQLSGTIHILGDLVGQVGVRRGDVLASGRILVDGSLYGRVFVTGALSGDLAGEVRVGGDVRSVGAFEPPIWVENDLTDDAHHCCGLASKRGRRRDLRRRRNECRCGDHDRR